MKTNKDLAIEKIEVAGAMVFKKPDCDAEPAMMSMMIDLVEQWQVYYDIDDATIERIALWFSARYGA